MQTNRLGDVQPRLLHVAVRRQQAYSSASLLLLQCNNKYLRTLNLDAYDNLLLKGREYTYCLRSQRKNSPKSEITNRDISHIQYKAEQHEQRH